MEQSESLNDLYDVSTADVYFLCVDDETKLVPAHKCILASDSQTFRKTFFENTQSQMMIDDCTLDTLTTFLKSFYCERFRVKRELIVELTHLAEKYNAKKCKSACWQFINHMIRTSEEDIFQALDLAITFNNKELRKQCTAKLMASAHFLIGTKSFASCSRQVFKIIIAMNFVKRNEVKVLEASIEWAKYHCNEKNLNQNSAANLRSVLGDYFHLIRFDKMTAHQFVQCLSLQADIFTVDELKNISTIIADAKKIVEKPMSMKNQTRRIIKTAMIASYRPYDALNSMFGDTKTADVFLVFGTTTEHVLQKVICAHKCILAAKSPVFKRLFYNGNSADDHYPISDANHTDFQTFIESFYHKTVDGLLTTQNIIKMIELAHLYEVTGFLDKCIDFATKRLCSQNIFRVLDLCFIHSNEDSVSVCLDWIIANENTMNQAFHPLSLVDCSQKTVEFALGLNFPNRDETQMFKASIEWAKKSCKRNQIEPTPMNLKVTLGKVFDLIRFSSMQPAEFCECVLNFKGMFSDEEVEAINLNIVAKLTVEDSDFGELMETFK